MELDRREPLKRVAVAVYLSWFQLFTIFAQAQLTESLNIDCGATSSYVDEKTGLNYVPDNEYIESGIMYNVSSIFNDPSVRRSHWNLRSFPSDNRNCYSIKSVKGSTYLIRAWFFYGNYDSLSRPPLFQFYIGADYCKTINLPRNPNGIFYEIITVATLDFLFICLTNVGQGIPVISEIQLVTLPRDVYGNLTSSVSLILSKRRNLGSYDTIRYPEDTYDRIWESWNVYGSINTTNNFSHSNVPSKVLQTASVPKGNEDSFDWWRGISKSNESYHIALYFAELEKLKENESREFNIYQEGSLFHGPLQPRYLNVTTVYSRGPMDQKSLRFSVKKTTNSTHPPLLNAYELFVVRKFNGLTTDIQDVEAIMGIKNTYQIKKNWMGDPCLPKGYPWSGLTCNDKDSPRITAINLSSSGLAGNISSYFANIASIEFIDLTNNNLTGAIPEFLAHLTSLKEVNLSNNSLSGSIPNSLKERTRNGLKLRIDNNTDLLTTVIENHRERKRAVLPIIISVTVAGFIFFVALIILCIFRRKNRQKSSSIHNRDISNREIGRLRVEHKEFTYSEVSRMTNNFENIIGKGGFGLVYSGSLHGMRVAVKVLSESSRQGSKEFSTEINLLMKIHHKKLVSLVGYCHEDTKMVLIYEYMAGGNLQNMLSSDNPNFLSWKQRLHIALDAAQGLEYLHHGCKFPIIHRDIKTANILLNERLEAKIADFGLSKVYPTDDLSHLSTAVMGTPGYMDPEYIALRHLNEKSDVYSFGVVLLELLAGRPPLGKNSERIHIVQWVNSILQNGEIREAIDPRLNEECDINNVLRFAKIALECTLQSSVERPNMSKVVSELKECLITETNKDQQRYENQTQKPSNLYSNTELSAR